MKNHKPRPGVKHSFLAFTVVLSASILGCINAALAAVTDIASAPIFMATTATTEVKPNVMFVLDDSGSMDWEYMPDDAKNFVGKYGFASSQCNGVYYNPGITYLPPVDARGTAYSNSSFSGARTNGFKTDSGTTDLSRDFRAYIDIRVDRKDYSDSSQAAYYYVYTGTQTTDKQKDYENSSGIFYRECNSSIDSTTRVDGVNRVRDLFTRKAVNSTSGPGNTDERTNFANWYSYYRTRMLMMKTSSGQAFKTLDQHFRVGFMTINANSSSGFLNIADFDSTQKTNWYSKLYGITPNDSTPLREALAYAGQIYAGKKPSALSSLTVNDPVQYSCQQNYTILSSDGFWNGNDSDVKKLDGTTMDNQDGKLPRPYNDGASSTSTDVTTYTTTQDRQTATSGAVTTKTWTKSTTVVGALCTTASTVSPPDRGDLKSAPMDIGPEKAALGYSSSNPMGDKNMSRCYSLGNSAWFCRGDNDKDPVVSLASVTDSSGKTWYLVDGGFTSSCFTAKDIFGNDYKNDRGVCPGTGSPGVAGRLVTKTPYTQIETISGATSTSVDRYTATQTRTQITTNGVVGALGALTPSSPSYTLTINLNATSTPATSDVFGSWTPGTANPNNVCIATAQLPTAGTTAESLANTSLSAGTPSSTIITTTGPTAGTTITTATSTGGTSNTLADVAAYYYNTNLRTSALNNCTGPVISPATTATDLCAPNKVPPNGLDTATWQHMTTFTLGLGARGRMVFSPTYLSDTSGDYFDVWKGNTASSLATPARCTWTSSGNTCDWPTPGDNKSENIDDLWHAAVNGHGNYFSATDPNGLRNALASSLNVIINTPKSGTSAAAATTNPKITSANDKQFSSYFKSVEWSGELIKQTMSLVDGSVPAFDPMNPVATAYDWSAQTLLDSKTYSARKIYTKDSGGLVSFTWGTLSATAQAYFKTPNISTSPPAYPTQITGLSQFCAAGTDCISAIAQSNYTIASSGAAGEALVNYLRGDRSNEEGTVTDATKYFRHRAHVLGDIVSAQPQYVGAPNKSYADTGYATFKTEQASRSPVVYVAANDGMLHAFDAATGDEKWAYIPSFVLPRLYTLADKNYANKHQYFVEGTPKTGDALINGLWKTILVGGLSGGGTGYYALDITDPATPVLLWEYSNANMGYTFGNPEITKLENGTWVVLVTSGYNNCARASSVNCVSASGDGNGYLYVLNASTGALVSAISTGVTGPSGLARIIAQAGSDNVTKRVYGGDLLGNLWRFTVGPTTGYNKQLLASFKDPSGAEQPIMARPQVTTFNGAPIVFVGTGRYLGATDVGAIQQQSFYGVKDNVTSTAYTSIRTDSTFIKRTAVDGACPVGTAIDICDPGTQVRTVSLKIGSTATDSITTKNGWFVDFPADSNEIEFTDPKLALGSLAFSTSVPVASTSAVCGNPNVTELPSFSYLLNYLSGGAVGTTDVIASTLGLGIATAPQIAQLPTGKVIDMYRLSSGAPVSKVHRFTPGVGAVAVTKRISWRELVTQ